MLVNVPITQDSGMVGVSEMVDDVFVTEQVRLAVNPVVDYEKSRYAPVDVDGYRLDELIYSVTLYSGSTFSSAGFTDQDVRYGSNSFKNSFLTLMFHDGTDPMSSNLIMYATLYPRVVMYNVNDMSLSPLAFVLRNPHNGSRVNTEGFYLYHYSDSPESSSLYMTATFSNAKYGTVTRLSTSGSPMQISDVFTNAYTKYDFTNNHNGCFYTIDPIYNQTQFGTNNVLYNRTRLNNRVVVNLYELQVT